MEQTLFRALILVAAAVVSAGITWLFLKAVKWLVKIVVFLIIFGFVASVLMSVADI